ncbi:MAG: SMI1/KNR4 family protein [Clostridium sp.]|uniref:SMI1/KNR4 family protein n=1 Tax=Clostridium sp. TaxID=1506 RepID=UPI002FC7913F
MSKLKFEKFEMKYGYFLPSEFKEFMNKVGSDNFFGSCNFECSENIVNNIIREYGKMDFRLLPFGVVGNGDYYCFYRYGEGKDDYYIGIWLSESRNFIVLCSSFESFLYRCCLDDYFSTVIENNEVTLEDNIILNKESIKRCEYLCDEYGFDIEKVKTIEDKVDYHRLMVDYDHYAIQSLCFLGNYYLDMEKEKGIDILNIVKDKFKSYAAPYYILGKYYFDKGLAIAREEFLKGIRSSLIFTGYSYWEEDYVGIPLEVHRNMSYYLDGRKITSENYLEKSIVKGKDPYSLILRLEVAEKYKENEEYEKALNEYANAIYCTDDILIIKDILKEALNCCDEGGIFYLRKLIMQDIKYLK